MGGTNKSSNVIIVDWENGMQVACNNGANRGVHVHYICTAVSCICSEACAFGIVNLLVVCNLA